MANHRPTGIIRPAGALVVGICLYHVLGREFHYAWAVAAFLVLLFLAASLYVKTKPSTNLRRLTGIIGLLAIAAIAFWLSFQKNTPKSLPVPADAITHYQVVISQAVAVKPTSVSTVGEVFAVRDAEGKWYPAQGKVAVFLPRSDDNDTLRYGQKLLVKGILSPPPAPANPYQFDYRRYLAFKHIQWQVYVPDGSWLAMGYQPPSYIETLSLQARLKLVNVFEQFIPEKRELAIAEALILGVQDDLDASLRNAYARTGTMHVLAVSGLHVTIVFGALLLILGPFRKNKASRIFISLLLLSVIWFYAFVTGLSASVLRSVVMFTVLEFGRLLNRKATIKNTLPVTASFLLCYEPNYLLDVGFQLSFLAVYGIVLLQPVFESIWQPEQKALRYVRDLLSISVAAQLATFPISLYYFHQFPVYFWLANLLAVPLTSVALYLGIAFMILFLIPGLGFLLGKLLTGLLWVLNEFLLLVEHLPQAVLEGFVLTPGQVIALYIAIIAGFLFLLRRQVPWLTIVVLCGAFISATELAEASRQRKTRELVIYSTRRSSAAGILNGRKAVLMADSSFYAQPQLFHYQVQPHWWARGIREEVRFSPVFDNSGQKQQLAIESLANKNQLLVWEGKRLLWLQKMPSPVAKPIQVDALILQHNAWAPLERLRTSIHTKTIVLDQTNSRRYIERKTNELQSAGYKVHVVAEAGAWVIRL